VGASSVDSNGVRAFGVRGAGTVERDTGKTFLGFVILAAGQVPGRDKIRTLAAAKINGILRRGEWRSRGGKRRAGETARRDPDPRENVGGGWPPGRHRRSGRVSGSVGPPKGGWEVQGSRTKGADLTRWWPRWVGPSFHWTGSGGRGRASAKTLVAWLDGKRSSGRMVYSTAEVFMGGAGVAGASSRCVFFVFFYRAQFI